jgi:hypothetical protein
MLPLRSGSARWALLTHQTNERITNIQARLISSSTQVVLKSIVKTNTVSCIEFVSREVQHTYTHSLSHTQKPAILHDYCETAMQSNFEGANTGPHEQRWSAARYRCAIVRCDPKSDAVGVFFSVMLVQLFRVKLVGIYYVYVL